MSVLAVISSIFLIVLFQYLYCFAIYVSIKLFYFSFRKFQYNIRLLLNEHFSVIILKDIFLYLIVMGINLNILTSWLNTSNIMQCINLLSLFIFYLVKRLFVGVFCKLHQPAASPAAPHPGYSISED
jgi:hypothetical protein